MNANPLNALAMIGNTLSSFSTAMSKMSQGATTIAKNVRSLSTDNMLSTLTTMLTNKAQTE